MVSKWMYDTIMRIEWLIMVELCSFFTRLIHPMWFVHFPHLSQSEVEDTLERIKSHKGVEGVIIGKDEYIVWKVTRLDMNPHHSLTHSLTVHFFFLIHLVNADGIPIRPAKGMDDELTHKYAANISQLAAKARSVIRDLDPQVRTTINIRRHSTNQPTNRPTNTRL